MTAKTEDKKSNTNIINFNNFKKKNKKIISKFKSLINWDEQETNQQKIFKQSQIN